MPNLQEPDWKSLRIGDVREFWERSMSGSSSGPKRRLATSRFWSAHLIPSGRLQGGRCQERERLVRARLEPRATAAAQGSRLPAGDRRRGYRHLRAGIAATHPARGQPAARQVLLFSGHRVDAPDRLSPGFPADKEPIAARKIAEALDQLRAGPDDLALVQAAAGGELL